jgi:glycosyltransferase involved in cell wall biosynthesis
MNKAPLVSVVCSTYNAERWLDGYFECVESQISDSFELIFVDAASTDSTVEKIGDFAARADNVKLIVLENRVGIYQAWNRGIIAASGRYFMNWNSDDLLLPSAINTYVGYAKKHPEVDVFYGPCAIMKEQSLDSITSVMNWPEHSHEELLRYCYFGPFPLVKIEAINSVGGFDEQLVSSGDYEMWLKLSKEGKNIRRIREVVGAFYHRQDSVSNDRLELAQEEDKKIQAKYK